MIWITTALPISNVLIIHFDFLSPQLFRPPENVKEHGERQYYTVVPGNSSTQVVRINAFWCDFARYVQAPVGEFLPLTWTQTGRT